jgi:hypothetical protein
VAELFDPGLQPERTDLAWRRTALGFFANAALAARFARYTTLDVEVYVLAGVMTLTGAVALWHAGRVYASRTAGLIAGAPAARPRALRALWAATTLTTLAALALAVLALA